MIPIFRSAEFIGLCLASVLAQELPVSEIILVDDCTDDDSIEIGTRILVDADVAHTVVRAERNGGAGIARNLGLAACTGNVVWFFDSDDLAAPSFTRLMNDALVSSDAQIVACRTALVDVDGAVMGVLERSVSRTWVSGRGFARMLVEGRASAYPGGHMFRREVLGDDPWDRRRAYEDMAATIRIALSCRSVALVDDAVYEYRQRADSVSKTVGPSTLGLFEMGGDVVELIVESGIGSRSAARAFMYREVLIPAAHMAMRADHAGVSEPSTVAVVGYLLDGARDRTSIRDVLPLLIIGEFRSAVFALVIRSLPGVYSRVLRGR